MAVKIRLARAGAKKAPFYRIVAADSRAPRDGRFIEILGRYNPRTEPSMIELDVEKVEAWIANGAQMTETAAKLFAIAKNPDAALPEKAPSISKKAAAKAAAAEAEAAAPKEVPAEPVAEVDAESAEASSADDGDAAAEASAEASEEESPAEETGE